MSLPEDRFDNLLSRIKTESQRTAIKEALITSTYEGEEALLEYVVGATKVEMIPLLQTEFPLLNNRMAGTLAGLLDAQLQQLSSASAVGAPAGISTVSIPAREGRQQEEHVSRMGKIVQSLKKCHINRPDETILNRIAKSESLLDLGSLETEYAYSVYENVKNLAGSETKSYIGTFLGMRVNGSVFDEFPFLLSAEDDTSLKMIKILRVADGVSPLQSRQQDINFEIYACNFHHEAIVPMAHHQIVVDSETAQKANCRAGENNVLVMPWYTSTLNKCPSANMKWIAREGMRIMSALEYIHAQGYVHLDVKATNIFVTQEMMWYLGDFGSCKPIGESVTSSTFQFCYENIALKPAIARYDWFMFLVLVLIETLEDRRLFRSLFYLNSTSTFADFNKVLEYARNLVNNSTIGMLIEALLNKLF